MDPIQLALLNRRKPTTPTTRPTTRPATRPGARPPVGPSAPPDFTALLAELSKGPKERTDAEWASLLDPRIKPYTDAIEGTTLRGRAFNEYNLETKAEAHKGLASAFLGILTGGKTGDEAMEYTKSTYGGSFLGGQAMQMAANELQRLTADFDERDYELTGQYLQAMQKIPALRDELRADLEKEDLDEYTRRWTEATLLIDESWRAYGANRAEFEYGQNRSDKLAGEARDRAEAKALRDEQLRIAREAYRRQQGLVGYEKRTDAVSEAREFSKQTGRRWTVQRSADGSWEPVDTGKALPKKPGSKVNPVQMRNSALREASDMTKATGTIWRVQKDGNTWSAYDTGQPVKKDPAKPGGGLTEFQKSERELIKMIYDDKGEILGSTATSGFKTGGMTPKEAFDHVYGYAYTYLSPFKRDPFIRQWVWGRLKGLGIRKPTTPERRSGQ